MAGIQSDTFLGGGVPLRRRAAGFGVSATAASSPPTAVGGTGLGVHPLATSPLPVADRHGLAIDVSPDRAIVWVDDMVCCTRPGAGRGGRFGGVGVGLGRGHDRPGLADHDQFVGPGWPTGVSRSGQRADSCVTVSISLPKATMA
ncbi:hypothetical protein FAIPA1_10056 [Frankia sp. AiPs1]